MHLYVFKYMTLVMDSLVWLIKQTISMYSLVIGMNDMIYILVVSIHTTLNVLYCLQIHDSCDGFQLIMQTVQLLVLMYSLVVDMWDTKCVLTFLQIHDPCDGFYSPAHSRGRHCSGVPVSSGLQASWRRVRSHQRSRQQPVSHGHRYDVSYFCIRRWTK